MPEEISEYLKSKFKNVNLVQLTGGYTNLTFLLKGTNPLLVAKLTNASSEDTLNEINSFTLLKETGITPHIYEIDEFMDKKMILMEYREGINAQSILDSGDWDKASSIYRELGKILAVRIHSITYDSKTRGIRKTNIESFKELNSEINFVPSDLLNESRTIFSKFDENQEEWVLTHGDYGVHNTLFEGSDKLTVLDWEWSEWANPLADMAWVCWFTKLHYPEKANILNNDFINAYVSHKNIPITADLLKYYSLYKVWNVLLKIQNASLDVQNEWIRRLNWTLNMDFTDIDLLNS